MQSRSERKYIRFSEGYRTLNVSDYIAAAVSAWAATIMKVRSMTLQLTSAEMERFRAMARKMLESDHDGEAIAALKAIRKEAEKRKATALTLLGVVAGQQVIEKVIEIYTPKGWETPTSLGHGLAVALRFPDILNDWERGFAADCAGRVRLTDKQAFHAEKIIEKVRWYVGG
jgi:hypothetical protein